ncbi:MAG: acyltransferase [Eubacterium sp.]|nr:acyltransferase [Eubacterium sp.]
MKQRIKEFDMIRAIVPFGIIIYHFQCHSKSPFKLLPDYANGKWGAPFVVIFLVLSGASLYYNYPKIESLKEYYKKRFLAIMPCFYLVWFYFYIEKVLLTKDFFFAGPPWKMLLTLIGMDGYLNSTIQGYYFIGEWFLGALVMMYLIYPLLLKAYTKKPALTAAVVLLIFALAMGIKGAKDFGLGVKLPFCVYGFPGIPSCLFSFFMGMVLVSKLKDKDSFIIDNKILLPVSAVIIILALFFKVPVYYAFTWDLLGTAFFIVIYHIGKIIFLFLDRDGKLAELLRKPAAISYPIFLVQHQIITKLLAAYDPDTFAGTCLMILAAILLSVVAGTVLQFGIKAFILGKKEE